MALDNPAARLLSILERGLEIEDAKPCRHAWCELLSVDLNDHATLMGRLGRVMSLSTDIVDNLRVVDGINVDRYMHWVAPLQNAFIRNNLNGSWKEFKGQINIHVINYLSMTSDLLSHTKPEGTFSDGSLEKIKTSASALIEEVRLSELPDDVRFFMMKSLYQIVVAVEEYILTGASSISSAVESAFGHGFLNKASVEAASTDSVAKKFWQAMANIALIVSITTGTLQLAPAVKNLLPDIDFRQETSPDIEELDIIEGVAV